MSFLINLPTNELFPLVPNNATPRPVAQCAGCPQADNPEHASCDGHFSEAVTPTLYASRLQIKELQFLQWRVSRMMRDAVGLIGSTPGYLFNATRSFNYSDSNSAAITAADGDELTLQFDSGTDPRKLTLWQGRLIEPEVGANYINGVGGFGIVQPGDEIEFEYPSLLHAKCRPEILEILDYVPGTRTLTLRVSRDVSRAMESADPDNPTPASYRAKIWQQAGNEEQWLSLRTGRPFYAKCVTNTYELNALDEDGILDLKNPEGEDTAIAPPDTYADGFHCYGRNAAGAWVDITSSIIAGRLKIQNVRAWIEFGPTDDDETDFRETYSAFRVTYMHEVPEDSESCAVPCWAHCKWARIDPSASLHNYPGGAAKSDETRTYFCAQAVHRTAVDSDTNADGLDDTRTYTAALASGLANFPANGRCIQYGVCDKWEPAQSGDLNDRPFLSKDHLAEYLRGIWFGADTQIQQGLPGVSTAANYKVHRVKHASLAYLAGMLPLETPPGMHEQRNFLGMGSHCASYSIDTDETGAQTINAHHGAFWRVPADLTELHDLTPLDVRTPGAFASAVEGFTDQRDPLDADALLDDTTDPTHALRNHPRDFGFVIERDTGDLSGRAISRAATPVRNWRHIIPDVANVGNNTPQVRGLCTFTRYSGPVSHHGNITDMGALIEVAPFRQPDKAETLIATRTVAAVTDLGGGLYAFDLENGPHAWSFIAGDSGARYDKVLNWEAGGCYPCVPPEHLTVNSFYDPQKKFGSPRAGAIRGDTVSFPAEIAGHDYTAHRFTIDRVIPFGGAAAPSWGDKIESARFAPVGHYAPAVETLRIREAIEGVDPTNGEDPGWVHGELFPPRGNAADTYSDSATEIVLSTAVSIGVGFVLQVVGTGELLTVTAVTVGTSTTTLTVTRGASPAAIPAGTQLLSETVCRADTGAPLTRNLSEIRPASLAAGEYWIDKAQGRVYFSRANSGLAVKVRFMVTGQTAAVANAYTADFTVPVYAEIATGITWDNWGFGTSRTVRYSQTGAALTLQAGTVVSAVGQFAAINSGGGLNIRVHLDDSGKPLTLTMNLPEPADAPGDGVGFTNNYTDWSLRRDRVEIRNSAGLISANPAAFVGGPINFYWDTAQALELASLEWAEFRQEALTALDPADYVLEHGTRRVWIKHAALLELPERICWRL